MMNFNLTIMKKGNKIILQILLLQCIFFTSCKKIVEVGGPSTSISSADVFNNDQTAAGSITYLYRNLSNQSLSFPGELSSLSCIAGLSADELSYYTPAGNFTLSAFYKNALTSQNIGISSSYWTVSYTDLYAVNLALEGLTASKALTPAVKQQLTGEARFMRAFYYFYLVNLYGDVPLVLTTDYTVNALITKTSKEDVYKNIVVDLKEAQQLLNSHYVEGDGMTIYPVGMEQRVRPTKWAATALLARTYLYLGDWSNAEQQASTLLTNTTQFKLVPIQEVFLNNNKEAIWQLQPVSRGYNTGDGDFFVIPESGPSYDHPVYLNNEVIRDFEAADRRKSSWIGSLDANGNTYYFPYKYKIGHSSDPNIIVTEYNTVMRLAEQYLIRSEARAQLGNIAGSISDIDQIRNRAGLTLIKNEDPEISKSDLLTLIYKERKREFFTEWGHRWLDLKRAGKIDDVMAIATPKKAAGLTWNSVQQYYPISLSELKANPKLTPTPGY